jgi:DNA segregation ATPase FtsK/SpoIIIE, S-DNA-T family
MARKESRSAAHARGFSDVIGILMIAAALLLLVAQLSFDRYDVDGNRVPPNRTVHNWIGTVGAYGAYGLFFLFGAGAFVLPVILTVFGLGYLFEFFSYLKRQWLWAGVLFVSGLGFFALYSDHFETLKQNLNAPSAGGLVGIQMNRLVFDYFGVPGATILFALGYLLSLMFLTNFQFGDWLRTRLAEIKARAADKRNKEWTPEEKALARRARELERQARQLQEEVRISGLGADLQPVPEPTVRDLSVPQPARGLKAKGNRPAKADPESELPGELDGEVITAREIAAATTADVLGRPPASKADPDTSPQAGPAEDKGESEQTSPDLESASAAPPKDSVHFTDNSRSRRAGRKPKPISVASAPRIGNYQLPSLDVLQHPDPGIKPTESKEELMANARLMQQTLAQFNIEVALGDITKGPTITRYELHPAPGVKLEKISSLTNNISAALKAERIHILVPVPGKSSVGVEVPNTVKTKVILRDLLESEEWHKTKARIPLALGKDVYGHPIIADLSDMPHLLIAGSTGSGKSVCINSIIASLLYRFPPDQLRFVMIDPKVVELQHYNALPHLVVPVVTDPKKVVLALRWVVNEMEKRYQIFAKVSVRNIKSFNDRPKNKPLAQEEPELPLTVNKEKIEAGSDGFAVELDEEIVVPREDDIIIPDKLSYIVVIIDELADLMLVAPADVEMNIARITQMARAAGIHCIVATQRPSVDVITGVIKANIPARIAFQVASKVDSRTILDAMGADKLLGKGDMLYLPPGSARLVRAQGALITDQEIQDIVDSIAKQGKPSYEMEIHQQLQKTTSHYDIEDGAKGEDEDLIEQCIEVIRSEHKASVSLLQRRLRLGYTRAARIMDELENRGIVGPNKGAEPRDILIDLDGTGADGLGQ